MLPSTKLINELKKTNLNHVQILTILTAVSMLASDGELTNDNIGTFWKEKAKEFKED